MQYSFESGQRVDDATPQPSPFTRALVEGLRTGEADRNEDGFVSINELFDYLEDRGATAVAGADADEVRVQPGRRLGHRTERASSDDPNPCRRRSRRS